MRRIFYDSLKRFFVACALTVVGIFSATAANLPSGYTELEYIESDGTQYIDTGLKNSDVDEYYIKFKAAYATYKFIFGNYNGENYKTTRLLFSNSDDGRMLSNVNCLTKQPVFSGGFIANDWNEAWSRNDNGTIYFKLNTQAEVSRQPDAGTENTRSIVLFSNYAGSSSEYSSTIAHIQFKKNGVLVFNGIPAKNSSNVIGMYDTVSGTFFTNAGTGTFTAGPAKCRNLFDMNTATRYRCSIVGSADEISSVGAVSSTYLSQTYAMAVKPNTTYTISKVGGNRLAIAGFKTPTYPSDTAITNIPYSYNGIGEVLNGSVTFTTDSDCVWIIFSVRNNAQNASEATNIQIEEGSTATAYVPYCAVGDGIKIATTKYTEDAFAGLITTLSEAINKVTNIVDTTVQQATEIGNLATTKQDRPDTDCPAGRKCLLIMGADNKPHWYLIQE